MMAKTHLTMAVLGASLAANFLNLSISDFSIAIVCGAIGSLCPDIDEPNSYIGRKLAPLSYTLSLLVRHRGVTHFLITPLLIAATGFFIFKNEPLFSLAIYSFAAGWFIHTLGDLATNGGIRGFFAPLSYSRIALLPKKLRFNTGGLIESVVFIITLMITIASLTVYSVSLRIGLQ